MKSHSAVIWQPFAFALAFWSLLALVAWVAHEVDRPSAAPAVECTDVSPEEKL